MNDNTFNAQPEITSEEKLLGLLSHLSIIFGGLLVPFIIWTTQKEKSKFVRFHSLQAIFYHLSFTVLMIFFILVMLFVMIISGVGLGVFADTHNSGTHAGPPVFFIVMMIVFYVGIFLIAIAGIVFGIYLGVKAYQGYLTKVPFIGKIIYRKVYETHYARRET
ncbi:MAG: DUF4870 domain-containing protein [bacterium]